MNVILSSPILICFHFINPQPPTVLLENSSPLVTVNHIECPKTSFTLERIPIFILAGGMAALSRVLYWNTMDYLQSADLFSQRRRERELSAR